MSHGRVFYRCGCLQTQCRCFSRLGHTDRWLEYPCPKHADIRVELSHGFVTVQSDARVPPGAVGFNAPPAQAKGTHVSESKPRDEGKGDGESWRVEALNLGVNPDEPDDWKYWSQLDRARGIIDSFRYHQPTPEQVERISMIRQAHIALARTILRTVGVGADQTHALRTVHESMMTCNKAIVNEPAPAAGAPNVVHQQAVDLTSLL